MGREDDGSGQEFLGAVFEDIAFIYLAAVLLCDQIVLSPSETKEVFGRFYPSASISRFPFGRESLYGVYVPDGLVVNREDKIISVIEYTSSKSPNHDSLSNKMAALRNRRRFLKDYFADDATLTLVVPRPHSSGSEEFRRINGIKLVELQFDRSELSQFALGRP